jgi:hypothetical protein
MATFHDDSFAAWQRRGAILQEWQDFDCRRHGRRPALLPAESGAKLAFQPQRRRLTCGATKHCTHFEMRVDLIRRHLPSARSARHGAVFTITAEIRAEGGGVRQRVTCKWNDGESLEAALAEAARIWAQLPKERKR